MVQHLKSLEGVNIRNTWLTIGSFDGIHIGHQYLIRELVNKAHSSRAKAVVLTFHPHPSVILRGRTGAFYLTPPSEKLSLLEELGVDIVITHTFTYELSQSPAREYISYLIEHLGFRQLWVGQDFALGKGREGNVPLLTKLGDEFGFNVNVVEPIKNGGHVVSSSLIRNLIIQGNIVDANKLLGRPYKVAGEVVHGDGRGKQIGIPTANIETGDEKLVPAAGVYACMVQYNNKYWLAAINIGTRPTFQSTDSRSHVEAHILDFSGDLYSQVITIEFLERLRGEEKFQSIDGLIQQIYIDIDQTRKIVANIHERDRTMTDNSLMV